MSIPQIVSFSGGRTSAYLVHLMEQRRLAGEDVHYGSPSPPATSLNSPLSSGT